MNLSLNMEDGDTSQDRKDRSKVRQKDILFIVDNYCNSSNDNTTMTIITTAILAAAKSVMTTISLTKKKDLQLLKQHCR